MAEYSWKCRCGDWVSTTDPEGTTCHCGRTVRDWLVQNKDTLEWRASHTRGPNTHRIKKLEAK